MSVDKRTYLRSLGFTVGERGRFSAEMLAALAAAPAGAVAADAPKPVKAPKAPAVKPAAAAAGNGAQRAAEALARREAAQKQFDAKRPSPLDMPRQRVRRETTGFTTVGGMLTRQDECGNAIKGVRHSVATCDCPGGPRAYKWLEKEAGGPLALVLDKPDSLAKV